MPAVAEMNSLSSAETVRGSRGTSVLQICVWKSYRSTRQVSGCRLDGDDCENVEVLLTEAYIQPMTHQPQSSRGQKTSPTM